MSDRLDNIVDQLIEGLRTMNEARTLRTDNPDKVTEADAQLVADNVRAYLTKYGLPHAHVVRGIGMSGATISQLFTGKFIGRWQQLAIDLDRWLEDELKRAVNQQPTGFVRTGVAEEVLLVADLATEALGIGVVFGESGIGKTLALKAVAAEKRGSIYVSCETSGTSPQALLEAIGKAMRISPGIRMGGRFWLEAIRTALASTSRLLIVDQIHKLCGVDRHDKALYTLVDIFDGAGSPQLWCGSIDMVEYLQRGEARGKEPLAQIRSRIVIARDLHERARSDDGGSGEPLFSIEDVRKLFAKGKLKLTRDGERYLMELANLSGSGAIRTCVNIVRIATKLNEQTGAALSEALLRQASGLLATRRATQRTTDRLEAERRTSVAMAG